MRRISRVFSGRCLLAVLPCVVACSGSADPPVQGGTDPAPAPPLAAGGTAASVHDVQIGVMSPVSLEAQPYAECVVHSSAGDAASGLRVQADDLGHAVFQARTERSATLVVDCDGEAAPRTIALHAAAALPAATSPAPARVGASGRRVREPLTGDPMTPTPAELLARGYPPRPDPVAAPAQFARWLDVVSRPMEAVAPNPNATKPGVGPVTVNNIDNYFFSPNWSGFVSDQPGTVYGNVVAEWHVPGMAGSESAGTTDEASVWVGLGGTSNNSPLVQAGETLAVSTFNFCFQGRCFPISLQSSAPWIEVVPSPLNQGQVNPGLTINPGDELYVNVWVSDLSGNYDTSGGIARFYLADLTTNQYTYPYPYLQIGGTFTGNSAEWIVERPALCQSANPPTNCSLYHLADFGQVTMTSTFALDSQRGFHTWYGDEGYAYSMENSGPGFIDRLSNPFAIDQGNTIQFDWYHFD